MSAEVDHIEGKGKRWGATELQMHGGDASTLEPTFLTNPSKWLVFPLAFLVRIVYNSSVSRRLRFAGWRDRGADALIARRAVTENAE
jgi:hypothetical protein